MNDDISSLAYASGYDCGNYAIKRRRPTGLCLLLTLIYAMSLPAVSFADNWPQWRGPDGTSVSREIDLPLFWSENSGIVWRSELPGSGTSTPVIWGDRIFVTTQDEDKLLVLALQKSTGKILWTREVSQGREQRETSGRGKQKFHRLHNLASPSPVTDGQRVVVQFGNGALASYDVDGNLEWRRNLQEDFGHYTIWWGYANSPVLYGDLVISVCMQDSLSDLTDETASSYLVAHDKRTGEVRWTTLRNTKADAEECDSYTTPIIYHGPERVEMIVMGGNQLDAYDPQTGRQLWFLPNIVGGRTITGPTIAHGMAYATRGMRRSLLAVKLGGDGEISSDDVVWKYEPGTPDSCCPVAWGDFLFLVLDNGVAKCLDARSGQLKWHKRLSGGDYKTSPLAAEGRIYLFNRDGLCTVIAASGQFEKLAENQLDDEFIASPAVSDSRLFIRGTKRLYCLTK